MSVAISTTSTTTSTMQVKTQANESSDRPLIPTWLFPAGQSQIPLIWNATGRSSALLVSFSANRNPSANSVFKQNPNVL